MPEFFALKSTLPTINIATQLYFFFENMCMIYLVPSFYFKFIYAIIFEVS